MPNRSSLFATVLVLTACSGSVVTTSAPGAAPEIPGVGGSSSSASDGSGGSGLDAGVGGSGGAAGAGTGGEPRGGGGGVPLEVDCESDDDCRLFDSECDSDPCACLALPEDAPDPTCEGETVACSGAPCTGKTAACEEGACVVKGSKLVDEPCDSDEECAGSLKCCYPCGIPDCVDVCTPPAASGECPMNP